MSGLYPSARQAQDGAILAPASPAAPKQRKRSRRERGRKSFRVSNNPEASRQNEVPAVTSAARYSQTPSHMLRAGPESQPEDCNTLLIKVQRLVALLEQQQTTQTQQTAPNADAPNYVYPIAASPQNTTVAAEGVNFAFPNYDTVGQQATNQLSQYTGWILENRCHSPGEYFSIDDAYIAQSGRNNYNDGSLEKPEPDMTALASSVAAMPLGALESVALQGSVQSYDEVPFNYEGL